MNFYKKFNANQKYKDHRGDVLLLGEGSADLCKREMVDKIVDKGLDKIKQIIGIRVVREMIKIKNIYRGCIGSITIK